MTDATIEQSIDKASKIIDAIETEVKKVIIGQDDIINQILTALIAGGHVLIEGVPGLGKTLLVRALAETISGEYGRIQFTPDLMPTDITGHMIYQMHEGKFHTHKGPIFTNFLLADEINRAPAKTQSALLEVMQEQQATIEGKAFEVPTPFMTLATQNPLEQEGTYPLPEAQMDRFLFKIMVDYPSEQAEQEIVASITRTQTGEQFNVNNINAVVKTETIKQLQKLATAIVVDEAVSNYAVSIVRATRVAGEFQIGAGPRASIALIRAAKANALMNGRQFITPADVKDISLPVLRHRVVLSPELELDGVDTDHVLTRMIETIEAPRQ